MNELCMMYTKNLLNLSVVWKVFLGDLTFGLILEA